ncbi:anti-sigma factor [Streptomyces lydicus]|uniref:anti-sigma factor n=1 Tax=Streptomyces lydicus TaxID=47763 RepID=UPI0036E42EE3
MSTQQHDSKLLSAYVLGALDDQEAREVAQHVASCEECRKEEAELREMELALGEVPPEAFLGGPPEGGDLLLQRTLRQARTERTSSHRRRSFTVGVAVAASATVVFLGGYLVADSGSSDSVAVRPPVTTAPTLPGPAPTGVLLGSATDPATQARMTVKVTPAADWVRVNAAVTGIPAGQHCRLVVVAKDGHREIAGSWVVGRTGTGAGKGADLDGSAATKAGDVKSVSVESESGTRFVTVPL